MLQVLTLALLSTSSVLATSPPWLVRRQDTSSPAAVYAALENFATEVTTKVGQGECTNDDSCAGWLNGALGCLGPGGDQTDEKALTACACEQGLKTKFDSCVTCVGSESATQTGQAFNQVCSASGGTESSASSSVEGEISSTATNSGEASETSSGTPTASSASSSASATNTTSEGSKTSSGASPTATDAGSGVKGLSDSRTTWISFAATLATIAYFGLA